MSHFIRVLIVLAILANHSFAATIRCVGLREYVERPTLNPENGHYYWTCFGVDSNNRVLSWQAAQGAAASMSFLGVPGHLVTITSAEENEFLEQSGGRDGGGGQRPEGWIGASDAEVEGEWRWVVGPEAGQLFWLGGPDGTAVTFADWDPVTGEPNDQSGEDYAMMGWRNKNWNDLPEFDATWHRQFVVEFSVPEPSSYVLIAIGALTLAVCGRLCRRRR